MKRFKSGQISGVMLAVVLASPLTMAAAADSAAEKRDQLENNKSAAAVKREMRLQAMKVNPPSGRTVEEVQRQSMLKQAAVRKDIRRQEVAEQEAARRAEAARLVMERTEKNN